MSYPEAPDRPQGTVPPQDDPWWKSAIESIGGFFDSVRRLFHIGSGYPKPLPPPLPFTESQIAAMLQGNPVLRSRVRANIEGEGHVHLLLGHQPTPAELDNVNTTARIALWLANGTGDDLSHGEADLRALLLQGMYAIAPATSSSSGGGGGAPGTGGSRSGGGAGTQAAVSPGLAVAITGGVVLAAAKLLRG